MFVFIYLEIIGILMLWGEIPSETYFIVGMALLAFGSFGVSYKYSSLKDGIEELAKKVKEMESKYETEISKRHSI